MKNNIERMGSKIGINVEIQRDSTIEDE